MLTLRSDRADHVLAAPLLAIRSMARRSGGFCCYRSLRSPICASDPDGRASAFPRYWPSERHSQGQHCACSRQNGNVPPFRQHRRIAPPSPRPRRSTEARAYLGYQATSSRVPTGASHEPSSYAAPCRRLSEWPASLCSGPQPCNRIALDETCTCQIICPTWEVGVNPEVVVAKQHLSERARGSS